MSSPEDNLLAASTNEDCKAVQSVIFDKLIEYGLKLETASVLKEAIALYRKFGFREYHPTELCSRCDQAYILDLS